MNLAEDALVLARLRGATFAASGAAASLHRLPVYAACTVLALVTNYLLGKDMAWDTLNYHFYAGFSALNDRFAQDYFAAGPPSYFNPYAYVPFYALVRAGLSPLEISSVLAAVHSAILWLTFELALCACPSDQRGVRMTYGVCAVAVAFLNPILVQQMGSSYADVSTAVLVLAGWLLLARAVRAPHATAILCAGLMLGAATALKLTNSVHAIAAFAMLIMLPRSLYGRIRYTLGLALALGLGFAMVAAPWSYRLERMFGNPMFPLMNGVFRSPEFTTEPLRHFRFIPDSLAAALWRPFAIADPVPMVQEELTAPDLRYAVLVVLVSVVFLRWLWLRRARSTPAHATPPPEEPTAAGRVLAALGCGLAADWALWLSASGNGRYFLPMASIAAVVIIALLFRLLANRPTLRNYILIALVGLQIVQLCFGANYRWNWVPWDRQWIQLEVPQKLATEPSLYLTMGVQSNSFIAPFLAKGSGLVNFSGGYALGPEGASGARIAALMHQYAPHLRVLWRGGSVKTEDERHDYRGSPADDALERFGLRIDARDCATISVHGLPPEPEITFKSSVPAEPVAGDTSYLTSCHIVPDDADRSAQIARERAVDLVFDRLEDACPALFQPRRLRTEHFHEIWRRLYVNTDLVALVSHGTVKFTNPVRGGQWAYLGLESDWTKAPQRVACGRRDGRYFARVLPSQP